MFDYDAENLAYDKYKYNKHKSYFSFGEWAREHNAKVNAAEDIKNYEKWKEKREMERKYLKGCYLKKKESKYGTFTKGSIKLEEFLKHNKPNSKGYINFCIFETKEGKPYAVLDDYEENKTNDKVIEFEVVEEDKLPF